MENRILQPGNGPIRSSYYVEASLDNVLWGRLPCASDRAVLTVDAGSEVTIDTISHEGLLEDQGGDPISYFARFGIDDVLLDAIELAKRITTRHGAADGPHVVTGPIAVKGAEPGDVLAITVLETLPRVPYGIISSRHGRGALPAEYPTTGGVFSVLARVTSKTTGSMNYGPDDDRQACFPLAPFLGIMGIATAGRERLHSVPPGPHGGNIDIRLLTAGSTLYLPVQVPGALAYVGDPHFAQGDGEVALTAFEASLRVTLRFGLIPAREAAGRFGSLPGPMVETADYLVPVGLDPDLDVALEECVRRSIELIVARFGMDSRHAYAYLSAATDFDISQVVDRVKGVHARIRKADFT